MSEKKPWHQWTPERRAKQSASQRARFADPAVRERHAHELRARLDALRDSVGFQQAITAGLRRNRQKISDGLRARYQRDPSYREKLSGKNNVMRDPAVKARHLEAVRAYHAKRKAQRDGNT
jgi:hypothetical protein